MQSQKSSTHIPRLPWGYGSAAKHGLVWWLIYKDTAGVRKFENSNTGDVAEAQKLLAQRALPRARMQLDLLERIANGEPYEGEPAKGKGGRGRKRPRSRGTAVSRPSASDTDRSRGGRR